MREKSNLLVLFRNLSDKSAGVQPSSDVGCRLESEFQSFGYRFTPLVDTSLFLLLFIYLQIWMAGLYSGPACGRRHDAHMPSHPFQMNAVFSPPGLV